MSLRVILATGAALLSFAVGVRAGEASERDRAALAAQMLQMTLPQCLLVDSDHAERAQASWKTWWKARADLLPKQYKQPLTKPPKIDSGMFAMSDAEIRDVCEKALASIENEERPPSPTASSP